MLVAEDDDEESLYCTPEDLIRNQKHKQLPVSSSLLVASNPSIYTK